MFLSCNSFVSILSLFFTRAQFIIGFWAVILARKSIKISLNNYVRDENFEVKQFHEITTQAPGNIVVLNIASDYRTIPSAGITMNS